MGFGEHAGWPACPGRKGGSGPGRESTCSYTSCCVGSRDPQRPYLHLCLTVFEDKPGVQPLCPGWSKNDGVEDSQYFCDVVSPPG